MRKQKAESGEQISGPPVLSLAVEIARGEAVAVVSCDGVVSDVQVQWWPNTPWRALLRKVLRDPHEFALSTAARFEFPSELTMTARAQFNGEWIYSQVVQMASR